MTFSAQSAVFFLTSSLCIAQSVTIGIKGGIRATGDVTGDATSESKRYIVGPMIEAGLPLGFSVEFDALYHRHGYRTAFANFAGSTFSRERANSWEFPILLKYRLPFPLVKPYVAGGYAPRTIHGSIDTAGFTVNLQNGQATFGSGSMKTGWGASGGPVAAIGVQLNLGPVRLSPEFRYTHWNGATIGVVGPQGYAFQSAQNQVDLLLGIGWKVH